MLAEGGGGGGTKNSPPHMKIYLYRFVARYTSKRNESLSMKNKQNKNVMLTIVNYK